MRHLAYFQQGDAEQLRHDIQQSVREQVRQQVEAARAQAQAAREQARAAREAAQKAGQDAATAQNAPVPPEVPPVNVPVIGVPPFQAPGVIPPQAVDIFLAFFITLAVIIVGWPIARAIGRRIERRGDQPAVGPEVTAQLQRIEQAVEAMAIEVERISEAQRYVAKLQSGMVQEPALKSGNG